MSKKFMVALCLVSLLVVSFSMPLLAEQKWEVRLASYFGSDHAAILALNEVFAPSVYEKTGGRVKINVFDNCQLGAEVEMTEALRAGTIEMAIFGNMLENTLPKMQILQQPFAFRNIDHLLKVVNGPVGEKLLGDFAKVGIVQLSGFSQGEVHLGNKKRPIKKFEDCKGLRMRVWEGKSIIESMKALGIAPTALALTETYTALQQGIVDGAPNSVSNFKNMGWGDQIKYVSKLTIMVFPNYYVANKKWWDKLPADIQRAIKETAIESAEYTIKILKQKEKEVEEFLNKEYGTEFITLTEEEKKPFIDACQVVIDDFCQQYPWAEELFAAINSVK